ncbi:MAG: polysaccharide deacetylase family protein [Bacteroidota bacterium]|jgi:peptidoglycan/xylan/chitin deacetylase (PgdA/CDA1 family)|nr:polysaccharide deacetylase family protein [Bacteroidota bacterium]
MTSHPLLRHLRYRLHSRLPRLYPGALCRMPEAATAAVTIDDGPSPTTPRVLDALDAAGLPATFFVSGRAVLEHPREMRLIRDRGHVIASHGFAHGDLSRQPRHAVEDDLVRSLEVIAMVSGIRPTLFRPPYGRLHPMHRDIPVRHGCALVLWSVTPADYDVTLSADELRRRMADVGPRDIVVLHDTPGCVERTLDCIAQLRHDDAARDFEYRTIT